MDEEKDSINSLHNQALPHSVNDTIFSQDQTQSSIDSTPYINCNQVDITDLVNRSTHNILKLGVDDDDFDEFDNFNEINENERIKSEVSEGIESFYAVGKISPAPIEEYDNTNFKQKNK